MLHTHDEVYESKAVCVCVCGYTKVADAPGGPIAATILAVMAWSLAALALAPFLPPYRPMNEPSSSKRPELMDIINELSFHCYVKVSNNIIFNFKLARNKTR